MIAFILIFAALGRLYRKMFSQPETRGLMIAAATVVAVGVLFYTRVEKWSVLDSLYFCVVTLGTVGYGDIVPTTDAGKIFTIFYIIFGLAVIGGFFASLGQFIHPGRLITREENGVARVEGEISQVIDRKEDDPAAKDGDASTSKPQD
jgi:voltage-gated potassium channel